MKRLLSASLTLALVLAFCLPVSAEGNERRLIVVGNATVGLPADTASIELGTTTKDTTVEAAQQQSDEIIGKVLIALKGLGIEEKDKDGKLHLGICKILHTHSRTCGGDNIAYPSPVHRL